MKIAKIIFGVIGTLIVVFVAGGFLLPSDWKVERSIVINAPSNAIYPYVSNLKSGWPQWSAFDFEDPDIKYSYEGPEEGVGATRSWVSKSMGNGTQKITKAESNSGVEFELLMEGNQFKITGHMLFEPQDGGTKVTWADWGNAGPNPVYRYMVAFMDKMMGSTFEKSLATLKSKVETTPAQ